MLPYERLWEKIIEIQSHGLPFSVSKEKGEINFEELISAKDDYNLNTLEYAVGIAEIMEDFGSSVDFTFRYKENDSITRKWNKHDASWKLYKVLNDALGLRFVLKVTKDELNSIADDFKKSCPIEAMARINPLSNDGYQGIHIYIKKDNTSFPIEVQLWTRQDALLNRYLRDTIYTRVTSEEIKQYARDLRDWLEVIPMLDRDFGVQSYIDYIYQRAFEEVVRR